MLIANRGIRTDTYYIPPFELRSGEIIVIDLSNRIGFPEREMYLKDIFTGKTVHESVTVTQPLTFVEHFIEPRLRRLFNPVSVDEYLKKHANPGNHFAIKIYECHGITPATKVNTLAGSPRGRLRLLATLSKTNNIVYDFVGQDPMGVEDNYALIKECARKGGAAIMLDAFPDLKNDCTEYIELEWL